MFFDEFETDDGFLCLSGGLIVPRPGNKFIGTCWISCGTEAGKWTEKRALD